MGLGKDRSKEWPSETGSKLRLEMKARNLPSGENDGDSSRKRPSVTSTMAGFSGTPARTSRRRLRLPKDVTGSEQASHSEAGDQARSSMLPSPMLVTAASVPSWASAMYRSPKAVPMAIHRPSGLASMALARDGLGNRTVSGVDAAATVPIAWLATASSAAAGARSAAASSATGWVARGPATPAAETGLGKGTAGDAASCWSAADWVSGAALALAPLAALAAVSAP